MRKLMAFLGEMPDDGAVLLELVGAEPCRLADSDTYFEILHLIDEAINGIARALRLYTV